jgi:hypothetical protein
VPNAAVHLHRILDPFRPDTVYTDSTGHVEVAGPLHGFYRVAAFKSITADEAESVGGVKRAFADGMRRWLPADYVKLELGSDQSGSLVISEFWQGGNRRNLQYKWDQFWELYNNSDTTIYLDGMLMGTAFGHSGAAVHTCEEQQPYREDPLGILADQFHQFPGVGQEYPMAPGQVVTIALDAIDHSQVHASLPDLSGADFELEGSADADNPDVPNLPAVGPHGHATGHGMRAADFSMKFLALPADPASLTSVTHPTSGLRYKRIPTDLVIDVTHANWMHPETAPDPLLVFFCRRWVNREFDRLAAPTDKGGVHGFTSLQRTVLRRASDGRAILQDLNVSFFDFVIARYSPGTVEFRL